MGYVKHDAILITSSDQVLHAAIKRNLRFRAWVDPKAVRDLVRLTLPLGVDCVLEVQPGQMLVLLLGADRHAIGEAVTRLRDVLIQSLSIHVRFQVDWHVCVDAERAAILSADALGGWDAVLGMLPKELGR